MGITAPSFPQQEDKELLGAFASSIKLVEGRYEVALPWKPMNLQQAGNEGAAGKRLTSLTNKDAQLQCDAD
ncbi:hypothetical protein HPB47_005730 [Ixodes persulcatus]|uniref:Uncharacterized protein n=1 Tax=Ixodes persulcatus TaxID=34615 RepID=A0AC60PC48_IXOPE|nr:hypothetical protein HPB47_005730 [Ixodes persulcatus]